ncbi:hypothetical protein [Rubellicoccus peritrichatus]|uniref:DUF4397 domain-containing protein n=1 Tax=Rubellicoccus peritrichatus TaxID=3080537 RepID=A0AAQ3QVB6_9BACT|nr:hypothetical protein [Puniceicoccus sp. CR14]WOO43276.1 hypothetical protein RZN69_09255 [Puniceicoccus sp. CR14]
MKFNIKSHIYLSTVFLACSVLCASAQLEDAVNITFRCISLDSPIRVNLYTQLEGGEPIRIYANSRTNWIKYSGPNPIVFYRDSNPTGEQNVRVPVGQFAFSKGMDTPLLLFTQSEVKGHYRITSIDDDLEVAPAGSYRIFNFTQKDIAGIVGSQRFRATPGDSALVRNAEDEAVEVSVRLAENAEDGPERLYAATWTYSPDFRYLIFIVPTGDRTRGNIKIRKITDIVAES